MIKCWGDDNRLIIGSARSVAVTDLIWLSEARLRRMKAYFHFRAGFRETMTDGS